MLFRSPATSRAGSPVTENLVQTGTRGRFFPCSETWHIEPVRFNLNQRSTVEYSDTLLGGIHSVQTLSLADACARYGTPDLAKVDIEGSEIEMLAAAAPFLRSNPIQLAVDTNHWVDGKLTAPAVEEILRSCGYETESDNGIGFMTTWARPRALRKVA